MIKAVVFDFDGTIADSLQHAIEIVNKLSDKYGYKKLTSEDLPRVKELNVMDFMTKMLGIPVWKVPAFHKDHKSHYKGSKVKPEIFPGLKSVLARLNKKKGLKLIIISSNDEGFIRQALAGSKIKFDRIISSSLFGKHVNIKKLMKDLRCSKEEMIYVGDESRDVIACKKAGIRIIAVSWGFVSEKKLKAENPDYLIKDPEDIIRIIRSLD